MKTASLHARDRRSDECEDAIRADASQSCMQTRALTDSFNARRLKTAPIVATSATYCMQHHAGFDMPCLNMSRVKIVVCNPGGLPVDGMRSTGGVRSQLSIALHPAAGVLHTLAVRGIRPSADR